jgi:hypothetical protein
VSGPGGHLTTVPEIAGKAKPDQAAVATTMILLVTGIEVEVDASLDKVVKVLEDASRSTAGTLARLTQAGTGDAIAINAAHVVAVRPGNR